MAKDKGRRPTVEDVFIGAADPGILKLVRDAGNAEGAEELMGPAAFMIGLRIAQALERLVELKEVEIGVRPRAELT